MKHNASFEVIQQLRDLLMQMNSEQFRQPLAVLNECSIGQHTRHVVEFYQCLLKALENGVVNYDARQRNLLIEQDLYFTLDLLEEITNIVADKEILNRKLQFAVKYSEDETEFLETNFYRELVYLIEHSIHHYALIKIGVQGGFPEIEIPQNFGVAFSTLKYRETLLENH
jgi:hypothetical protein